MPQATWKAVGVLFLASSCSLRPSPVFLEQVQVSGLVAASGAVVLPVEKVEAATLERFRAHGGFSLGADGATAASSSVRGRVTAWSELGTVEDSPQEEVRVLLELRPLDNDEARFEVTGQATLTPGTDRNASVLGAFGSAVTDAVLKSHAVFSAWKKQDVQLLRDLRASDKPTKEAAIDVLAFRKNPAVADALLERLQSPDVVEVRRAMGGLVELRELRAVPALIELARAKDLSFLREILFALSAIGGEEARAYLFTVAQGHDVPAIREAASVALSEANPSPTRSQP